MSDTVKIPRPKFIRRKGGPSGRAQHDERGNAIWVRTRASDAGAAPSVPEFSLVEETSARPVRAGGRSRAAQKSSLPKSRKPG